MGLAAPKAPVKTVITRLAMTMGMAEEGRVGTVEMEGAAVKIFSHACASLVDKKTGFCVTGKG
jgi:hypothetical protein